MKFCHSCLCCAVLVLAGMAVAQEPSDAEDLSQELGQLRARLDELETLRTRLNQLEEKYARQHAEDQRTIAELKAQLEDLKTQAPKEVAKDELDNLLQQLTTEGAPAEGAPRFTESLGRYFQSFNPDLSVIGDFLGHYSSREGGELDDEFLFRHLELGLSGNVDPYTRADVFVGIGRHAGDWHIHLGEAYLTYLGLPWDLQPRVGRFKSSFGRANPQHVHALPWVEYPFVIQNYFGDEGLSGDGAGLSWLVPNPWDQYVELTYEVINNDSALFAGEETDDFVHLVHLKGFFELSEASTLETGLSFATAPNDEGHGGNRTYVEGVDLTYKWRPPEAGLYKLFLWQTELLAAQADLIGGQETSWGMYTAADYQFARRWAVGTRYDYAQMPYSSSRHEHGASAYLTFLQSEYLFWRLAYQYTDRNFRVHGDKQEHEIFLQCNFGLGPHRAHKY